jgi:hypothetical protein
LIPTPGIFQTEKETIEIEEETPAPSSFLLIDFDTADWRLALRQAGSVNLSTFVMDKRKTDDNVITLLLK